MFKRVSRNENLTLVALGLSVMLALPVVLAACTLPPIPFIVTEDGTCIDDVTGRTNNCTANDVRLGTFYNTEDIDCVSGEMVEVFLQADVVAGSHERYDIGMFIAQDGGDARTGECYRDFLNPIATEGTCEDGSTPCNKDSDCEGNDKCLKPYDALSGFGPFHDAETDDDLDVCGDLEQGVHNYYDLAPTEGIIVPCIDTNGDGTLDIGTCTSWDSQKTGTCEDVEDAVPSTKAKCNCEIIEVGNVYVLPGTIEVRKDADPVEVMEPGGDVDFTFTISNTSDVDITIFDLDDTVYGDLHEQGTCTVPQDLGPAGSFDSTYTCSLTAFVGGNPFTQTNTIVVTGEDENENEVTGSDSAQVRVLAAPPEIEVDKAVEPGAVPEPGGTVTYTVTVTNTSGATDPLTLTILLDDLYGDLMDETNPLISNSDCELVRIEPDASYSCTFNAEVAGNAGDTITDTVEATGQDDEGSEATDMDTAEVMISDLAPAIEVGKSVDPASVLEPGDLVTYTVSVMNVGSAEPLILTALMDNLYGDLTDGGNSAIIDSTCELVTIDPGGTYTCTFEAEVHGNANESVIDTVTGTGEDDEGQSVEDWDSAEVAITNVLPSIEVVKIVDPESVVEPGGDVLYTVRVKNTSVISDPVTLTSLTDDIYNDLTDDSNPDIFDSDCELVVIEPGLTYECTFGAEVTGSAGDTITDTVTAVGYDDEENMVQGEDDATVTIVWEPPDTGVDLPVSFIAGGLGLLGLGLVGAGIVVRRRNR